MALFQKKTDYSKITGLYTLGANKSVLILGLGNPGKQYDSTRHNIGFTAVDYFAETNDFPGWVAKKDLKAELCIHTLGSTRVVLAKPSTFMNASGEAASAIQHFYKIYNPDTLAVYDELAINFGQLRSRAGGSDAGHNGVKSLIQHVGDDFNRLRIGVGNDISQKADPAEFVLGKFTKKEQESVPLILREANALINEFIFSEGLAPQTRAIL